MKSLLIVTYLLSVLSPAAVVLAVEGVPTADHLIITELKVRNGYNSATDTGYDEYIELYNPTEDVVVLGDYLLEYTNASGVVDRQPISQMLLPAMSSLVLEKPAASPQHVPDSIPSPFDNLTDGGGWMRLLDVEGNILDEIGWTSTPALATANDVFPVVVYCSDSNCKDKSITKQKTKDTDTYPAKDALWMRDSPSPQSVELLELSNDTEESEEESSDDTDDPQTQILTCEGAIINELLPNAAGSDTGKEFIELYNPTDEAIDLTGCSLQIASSSKLFTFGDISLQPSEYRAFSDTETGLTLPNSAGGKVWLLSATNDELEEIPYPAALDDDAAWALIDGLWQQTYQPTPNTVNVAMLLKPCEAGQQRNVETGRCQSIAVIATSSLTSCRVGQERNPETGRCRNIITASAALTPCKVGQERNPETNRCRTVTANDGLSECPAGQERNPETNRCRKSTDGQALAAVSDIKSTSSAQQPKWLLIVAAGLLAIGYALYEWRSDMANWVSTLRSKFSR